MIHRAKKIIVVGGNAAGPAAAAKAKRVNPEAEIILFEAGEFISTGTCELPYLLSGEINNYKDIVFFDAESFQRHKGVKAFTRHRVDSINTRKKTLVVKNLNDNLDYEFEFDVLILATGSIAKKYPGFSRQPQNAFTLKSVTDYIKIKDFLDSNLVHSVTVFGAGYIGLETAEAFRKLNKDVNLVEFERLPLPGYEDEIRSLVKDLYEQNGINFYGGVTKPKFNLVDEKITSIVIDSRIIDTEMVIFAVGVTPNNTLAQSCGIALSKNGGIKVDKFLQTSIPFIYAAGDCIEVKELITNQDIYLPIATLARDYGYVAGSNAAGKREFVKPVIKNIAVKLFDKIFASVGLSSDEAKKINYRAESVSDVIPNLVKVMPQSQKVFGKLVYSKTDGRVLGASFLGKEEAIGYADIISLLIQKKGTIADLNDMNFNYTPPASPFVNILSHLARKATRSIV